MSPHKSTLPRKSVSSSISSRKPLSESRRKSISITISPYKSISAAKPMIPIDAATLKSKYPCPHCRKSHVSSNRRASHIRASHGQPECCASCDLPQCIHNDRLEHDYCHDGKHGGITQMPPQSSSTSDSSSRTTSPFGHGLSTPAPVVDFLTPCASFDLVDTKRRESTPSDNSSSSSSSSASSSSSSSASSSSSTSNSPLRQCALCPTAPHCALPGCRARGHCHDPAHAPRRPALWSPSTGPEAAVGGAHVRSAEDAREWQCQQDAVAYGLRAFDAEDLEAALIAGVGGSVPASLEWPAVAQ